MRKATKVRKDEQHQQAGLRRATWLERDPAAAASDHVSYLHSVQLVIVEEIRSHYMDRIIRRCSRSVDNKGQPINQGLPPMTEIALNLELTATEHEVIRTSAEEVANG